MAAVDTKTIQKSEPAQMGISPSVMILIMLVVILLFSVIYVRHLCIRSGYAISGLSEKLGNLETDYQQAMSEKTRLADYKALYEKGSSMGFVFPDTKRTFNVR